MSELKIVLMGELGPLFVGAIAAVCGVVIGRALAGIVFKDDNRKD